MVPWTTLAINLPVSLLLGMLVVAVPEIWRPHRLIRPLLGTGVLGVSPRSRPSRFRHVA